MSSLSVTPLGGSGEVGASCYLVCAGDDHIIIDCGMHPKKEGAEATPEFALVRRAPDACLISHSHVDHCGSLPLLLKQFPATIPYATGPTVQIMDRMLHNSVSVMTKIKTERNLPEYPLFDHRDVEFAMRRTYGIPMDQEFAPIGDSPLRACFHHAGHVLGSAQIRLDFPGHRILYTGDICDVDQELMAGFEMLDDRYKVDTLIIESTYGANEEADEHSYEEEVVRFSTSFRAVLERGGCVMVPSFALGRTQEMLNIIDRMQADGVIPDVPVYVSGLGRAVYEIYEAHQDHLKPDTYLSPLSQFERIGNVWEKKVVKKLLSKPCIIVATSGMMIENTPSALIAEEMLQHEQHAIYFVGYCDPDSLGHKVKHARPGDELTFVLGGEPVKVKLQDVQSFHFSAHAPRKALKGVVERLKPTNVIFVHGDPDAIDWMYNNSGDGCRKFKPHIGQTVQLDS